MKVYVLWNHLDYYGPDLEGIYAREVDAQRARAERGEDADWFEIEPTEVVGPDPLDPLRDLPLSCPHRPTCPELGAYRCCWCRARETLERVG